MELRELAGLAGVPIVVALVQALKPFVVNERAYPLLSLVLGIGLNVAVGLALGTSLLSAGLLGLVAGLAASGLYAGGKAVAGR